MALYIISPKRISLLHLTFLILFIFTLMAWLLTRYHFRNRFKDAFTTQAKSLVHILNSELLAFDSYLYFGKSFFDSSDNVTREEFNQFYSSVIDEHNQRLDNIYFSAYVEKVTDKGAYENNIRAELTLPPRKYASFRVYPNTGANEQWVMKYVTHEDEFNEYLGYDVLADSNFANDFIKAAERNQRVFTEKKVFTNLYTTLIIQPIYNVSVPAGNPEEMKSELKGFIVLFLNLNTPIANQIDDEFFTKNVSFSLYLDKVSLTNAKDYSPLYTTSSEALSALNKLKNNKKLQYLDYIDISDKKATVIVETFEVSSPKIFELNVLDIGFFVHSFILVILFFNIHGAANKEEFTTS